MIRVRVRGMRGVWLVCVEEAKADEVVLTAKQAIELMQMLSGQLPQLIRVFHDDLEEMEAKQQEKAS